jgi:probable rRNA maturation factor
MTPSGSTVLFGRLGIRIDRQRVRKTAALLCREVAKEQPFTCYISNDAELQRLNQQFLQHDYPTDVLSFPAAPGSSELGELAISAERAAAQALEFGQAVEHEIEILMLHGLLHLLGMDHETDGGKMRRTETQWRRKLGFAAGLIERVRQ